MSDSRGPTGPVPYAGPEVPFPLHPGNDPLGGGGQLHPLGPGLYPIPGLIPSPRGDGGKWSRPPTGCTEAPGEAQYRAYRVGGLIFLRAEGMCGSDQIADLRQSSLLIFPPQFELMVYTPLMPQPAIRPFRAFAFTETFPFNADAPACVVRDAKGQTVVPITDAPAAARQMTPFTLTDPAGPVTEAVGHGRTLQEAFDAAVAQLPSQGGVADGFVTYTVVEQGSYRGGFAGVGACFCKVAFTEGAAPPSGAE